MEKIYYQKYLKYKNKYLELKRLSEQQGGITLKHDKYLYVVPASRVTGNKLIIKADEPIASVADLNKIFDHAGFRIRYGADHAKLIMVDQTMLERPMINFPAVIKLPAILNDSNERKMIDYVLSEMKKYYVSLRDKNTVHSAFTVKVNPIGSNTVVKDHHI